MDRELPPELSPVERSALTEFFRGNLSAGQLTQRLGHSKSRTETQAVSGADAPALRTDSSTPTAPAPGRGASAAT